MNKMKKISLVPLKMSQQYVKVAFLDLEIQLDRKVNRSFLIPEFRSVLGFNLKNFICKNTDCDRCKRKQCWFQLLFRGNREGHRENIPPFILKSNQTRQAQKANLQLLLMAEAIQQTHLFCNAFLKGRINSGANFYLRQVTSKTQQENSIYYDGNDREYGYLLVDQKKLLCQDEIKDDFSRIAIRFITPTRLKKNKKYLTDSVQFYDLFHAVYNRYRKLIYLQLIFEGKTQLAEKFNQESRPYKIIETLDAMKINPKTVKTKLRWEKGAHITQGKKKNVSIGGILGEVIFEGNIEWAKPLLRWGELFQIGEKVTYGLGQYQIIELD